MARFRLSQAAFEAAVAEVKAGTFGRGRVGLYRVKSALQTRPGVINFETGYDVLDRVGFEFDARPNHIIDGVSINLTPNWYTYRE